MDLYRVVDRLDSKTAPCFYDLEASLPESASSKIVAVIADDSPRRYVFGGVAPAPASAGLEPAERVTR